ncbi:MAG: 1,4-dihydroxy-2-naphthoate octaprenyltransferase [Sedimenticola sp.]|nr:MAG: 1,4-dihydroxy-2-naphthoate octaprenyltransferase [Sedimenticola sp.]
MNSDEIKRQAVLWFMAIRPRTLALSFSPVVLGTVLALVEKPESANWLLPGLVILAAVAIQAGTNLFNDSADYINGTDDQQRIGPERITATGQATPAEVTRAGYLMFLLAGMIGIYLVWVGGLPILLLGILSLTAGFAYSHGPWPISRTPLGELFVILFFGIAAVAGTYYLHTRNFNPGLLLWGVAIGLPAAAVLLVNNTRDVEGDTRAGRRTLAILLDLTHVRVVYALFMLLPFVLIVLASTLASYPLGSLLGLVTLPWFMGNALLFWRTMPGPEMNRLLVRTVRAQLLLTLALSVGLYLSLL